MISKTKKVLIVIGTLSSGGAERNALILANNLSKRGWDVTVGHIFKSEVFYNFDSEIKILDLSNSGKNGKNIFKIGLAIRKLQKKESFHTIISFFFSIGAITQLFCPNKKRVQLVCRETDDPKISSRNQNLYKILDIILRKADAIIFQNTYQQSCYSKKLQNKSFVINNPVILPSKDFDWDEKSNTFVSIGRLEKVKDYETMIEGFGLFLKSHPDFRLEIYGIGTQKENLKALISALSLENNVFLMGRTTTVFLILGGARLYLHSSINEGLPNSLLEAFLAGVPVISSDWSGYDSFLENEKNSFIFEKRNSAKLAQSISFAIENTELCRRFIDEAKKQREKFNEDLIIDSWEIILNKKLEIE